METLTQTLTPKKDTVLILRTTVQNYFDVQKLGVHLDGNRSITRWSVDLDDWERVLKVVGTQDLALSDVLLYLHLEGHQGGELQD